MPTAAHRRLIAVAVTVVGLGVAAIAPAAADPAPWTAESVAAPTTPSGVLTAVSCPTSTLCFAVGTVSSPAGTTTSFAQRWNGTAWTRVSSTTPTGAVSARLDGVSCVNATTCVAVGSWRADVTSTNTRPFAARWNGTAFVASSVPPAAGFPSSGLRGVSCLAGTARCVAVGYATRPATTQPYAVVFTGGASWQALPTPPTPTTYPASLAAVSCTDAATCTAVGVARGAALVERFDGASWTIATTPDSGPLTGVSCVGSSFCAAVSGQAVQGFDAPNLQYDGTSWTAVPVPHDATTAYRLQAVSCVSATDCTAVGDTLDPDATPATVATSLLQHWDGTAWTARTLPQKTPASNNVLTGVACSATACTAVGRFGTPATGTYISDGNEVDARPLALTGSGTTWQLQDVAGAKSTRTSEFRDISCPTATFCAAVGEQGAFVDASGAYQFGGASGLVSTWDGATWSVAAIPATVSYLTKVSCATATACLAIGFTATGVAALRWDGTSWTSIAPAPSGATAVSCDTVTSCTVVNGSSPNSYHWDGTTWTPTAVPAVSGAAVDDISCTSAQNCVAVGGYRGASGTRPLVLLRSAAGWRQINAVPAPTQRTELSGVSCTAANGCTAVGTATADASNSTGLVTTWNGSTWTQVTSPQPGNRNELHDVWCTAPSACAAVGVTGLLGTGDPLVESWDGTAWTQVPAARPAGVVGVAPLAGVSCVAGARCRAVGSVLVPDGGFRPYILSGSACPATLSRGRPQSARTPGGSRRRRRGRR